MAAIVTHYEAAQKGDSLIPPDDPNDHQNRNDFVPPARFECPKWLFFTPWVASLILYCYWLAFGS